jgi:sarcosine oxidase subunit beta
MISRFRVPDARDFPATCDVLIVGGGVIGAATAFYASRAGLKSIVVEKRNALGELTTSASLAGVRAQFAEPENIALMQESLDVFEHFHELTGAEIDLHQQGYLFLTTAPDGPEVFRARIESQRASGLRDVEYLPGDKARARFPFLAPEITAATFRARDGWLSAHELTYGFARASTATFFLGTPVTGWRIEADRITGAITPRGDVRAAQVVLAAGPFSRSLARGLGIDLPLENIRRQRVALKQHPLIPRDAPMTIDSDTGAHWRPDGAGAVLAWAQPEPASEPQEYVVPDWDFPAVVLEGVARLAPFWSEIIFTLKRSDLSLVAGQYTETPDTNPLIGAFPEIEGLYLNTGYGGHGVMASPGGARLLTDLLTGKMKEANNPFRATRFQEARQPLKSEKMIL